MVTYSFGNQSVDHVMRRYGHLWEERENKSFETDQFLLILRSNNEAIANIADKLEGFSTTDKPGAVCAKAAMCRLEATFKAAYGLIRRDYIFEASAMVRMVLEQIAWAHQAHRSSENQLRNLNPTRCITPFKAVFSEAGRFYGELSEDAHLDPSIVDHYVRFHSKKQNVVRRSSRDSRHVGYHLTALASVYLQVVQELFALYSPLDYVALEGVFRERHRSYCNLLQPRKADALHE